MAEVDEQEAILRRPSFSFAKRHGLIVGAQLDDGVELIARQDVSLQATAEMRRFLDQPIQLRMVSAGEFDRLLQQAYENKSGSSMQMVEGFDDDSLDLSSAAEALSEPQDLLESDDDAPIIRLINALLAEAIKEGASDIHIEPYESRLTVRLRVDGVLREVLQPPRAIAPLLSSRIKVMARLDIAEKRLPQDGRISLRVAGRPVDVRVSTIPSGHGERVVMRLLDKQAGRLDLEQLGMAEDQRALFQSLIKKPHGIILVTGPTGSGKTTTLYAGLAEINDRSRNIMTVEDPIEYYIDGIGQTQVNTKVDMSFARGLRAILRQDPDVVMVGEIRDLETAEIAVQASLTGHLVLSTLHTNSAVGAVARLRDMGVEPFLLASSLIGLMAQRLVRTLCPHCRTPYEADDAECELFGIDPKNRPTIYNAVGCTECRHTGYLGRSGIQELVAVDEAMRTMIHDGSSEQALEVHARRSSPSIRQAGLRKVLEGRTTVQEVLRVTREG
ncbi:type II secretion system ATPase GspE [uncultured Abyssibacter sp.]|uniref:type II secretion system ATPase GspE n=1 Tax=uncultured Abyssibacter sp. TaxID=2320202 RepID=UPI0032B27516